MILLDEIDVVRRSILQIKSDVNPSGLIQATWRIQSNVPHLDAMIGRVRERVLETAGKYDIFPDLYSLCWDCLEPDLYSLRLYMARVFLPKIVSNLNLMYQDLPYQSRELAGSLVYDIRNTLISRVQEVCRWFIRPVFRRDSYSLRALITTTFSTICELDDLFRFQEFIDMELDITISRGSFDIMGDTLFVLIGNAARHGKADGTIAAMSHLVQGMSDVVEVRVTSDLDPARAARDMERIVSVFQSSNSSELEFAAVQEGFSGLRKVIGQIRRFAPTSGASLSVQFGASISTVTFTVHLPVGVVLRKGLS